MNFGRYSRWADHENQRSQKSEGLLPLYQVTTDQAAVQIEKIWKEREFITAAQRVG
jgi:hypothetical protein